MGRNNKISNVEDEATDRIQVGGSVHQSTDRKETTRFDQGMACMIRETKSGNTLETGMKKRPDCTNLRDSTRRYRLPQGDI